MLCKKKSKVCFFWGQKDVNAGVWQWGEGGKEIDKQGQKKKMLAAKKGAVY